MPNQQKTTEKITVGLGVSAILAAIGASVCCVGPLLFLSLGIGGAWMSTLTSMEAVRPFFFALTLLFIWIGFIKLYLSKENCKQGEVCNSTYVLRNQRKIFWIGTVALLSLLSFPWYVPYFM